MKNRGLFSLLAIVALTTLIGCATQPHLSELLDEPEVVAEFTIPSESKAIILPLTFKGEEYQFILDTGSTPTVFDDDLKEKLGRKRFSKKGKGAFGNKFSADFYEAPKTPLGPFILGSGFRDLSIVVVDLDFLSKRLNTDIHGIVGMDDLKKYAVQFDFKHSKVRFMNSKKKRVTPFRRKSNDNEHTEWGKPNPIKCRGFFNIQPYVRAHFTNGTSDEFLIDTGTLNQMGNLRSRTIKKLENNVDSVVMWKNAHTFSVDHPTGMLSRTRTAYIDSFAIGELTYKDMIFSETVGSRLGLHFFSRHSQVTFDFPNEIMYLRKGDVDLKTFWRIPLGTTGITLEHTGEHFVVGSIETNEVTLAVDLKEKDILRSLSGVDLEADSLMSIANSLKTQLVDRDVLNMEIERAGEFKTIEIPLAQ